MSLQGLTAQAAETKEVLMAEFERIKESAPDKPKKEPRRKGRRYPAPEKLRLRKNLLRSPSAGRGNA